MPFPSDGASIRPLNRFRAAEDGCYPETMSIHVLPTPLVNKIAAGEVVERPASIVKELVENALDAEAGRIEIAVEDGGRKAITVTDDGIGMSPDDLKLAFVAHATGKISDDEDLFAIETMGFRGEALASIAAVSHAHIRSRRRGAESGYEVSASGGEIAPPRPCAASAGTAVSIRDLFYNTPARRKFMRTTATEFAHISEQLARLALPHPRVAFRLTHNGRESANLPPADSTAERVADLFGRELADALLPIRPRGDGVSVAGLLAPPAAARSSSKWQYCFVNGRYIRDRLLSHALREAYRGRIDVQRWPVAFIFVEIDPADVDVNVHPTKIEVRFRNGNQVHGALLAALRETLNRANLSPTARLGDSPASSEGNDRGEPASETPPPSSHDAPSVEAVAHDDNHRNTLDDARRHSLRQALADFLKAAPPRQQRLDFSPHANQAGAPPAGTDATSPSTAAPGPSGRLPLGDLGAPAAGHGAGDAAAAIMQVHNSYIVAATDDGIIVVDQHALHERLLYNDLQRRLAESDGTKLTSQRLLIPETVTVAPAEADALNRRSELLDRLGIEVQAFGPRCLAVQRFCALLAERGVGAADFVREIAGTLAEDDTTNPEQMLQRVLAMMACKAAVKAGEPLSEDEMRDLLARRREADKAAACPHGRPTTLTLTLAELARQFGRS
ncbi:MAG: DNA mismatch repair endonuclease MutL [Phycisphaerae bacterium]|nr:DNA mismatch repair endonuclease MutL [Phycisphaerae bacterium]